MHWRDSKGVEVGMWTSHRHSNTSLFLQRRTQALRALVEAPSASRRKGPQQLRMGMRWQRSRGGKAACCQDQTMQVMATDSTRKTISYSTVVMSRAAPPPVGSSPRRAIQTHSYPATPLHLNVPRVVEAPKWPVSA